MPDGSVGVAEDPAARRRERQTAHARVVRAIKELVASVLVPIVETDAQFGVVATGFRVAGEEVGSPVTMVRLQELAPVPAALGAV